MLRRLLACALLVLCGASPGGGARALTAEELGEWTQTYYAAPKPDEMPEAIALWRARNYLAQPQTVGPILGFLSAAIARHPERLDAWLAGLDRFSEAEQRVLVQAVWLSGTPQGRAFLAGIPERLRALLGRDLSQGPSGSPDRIRVQSPGDLDFLWGRFFASGSAEPVRTIIAALPLRNVKRETSPGKFDAMPPLIGAAAQWSLTSNAGRYDRVLAICRAELARARGETADLLREVVAKAEERRRTKRP